MKDYSKYIHKSRYARWNEKAKRRETWEETVDRYMEFFGIIIKGDILTAEPYAALRNAIINMDVVPSMRSLMTAGKALERDNVAGYNCAYVPVDSVRTFDETLYILCCGTGVGYSVERQYIN